ncbi:MAG: pyruvate:ferredoxin (flavodoxin) oxidoreductase, partial [Clostridia bacterium]|nr:pyruvate:ferredoxin (flavodoxin) oxidoreductase [Clostridia bacterium]
TFLLNSTLPPNQLIEKMPASLKRKLAKKQAKFYIIDAVDIAKDIGLGNRTNMIMQAAFFKLTGVIPEDLAIQKLYESIEHAYGRKGEKIVNMNKEAVKAGMSRFIEVAVDPAWAELTDAPDPGAEHDSPFVRDILKPMSANRGNELPVSAFVGREDGTFPSCGSRLEKRGVASFVPRWIKENCIQCNQCSFVCPHASIRPVLTEEGSETPQGFESLKAIGKELAGKNFRIQVSPYDCQGCGVCVMTCPSKEKALVMETIASQEAQAANWEFAMRQPQPTIAPTSVKNSQFRQPLLEFAGACAGCGETPYVKLISQLFGERMMIANATGCSSIWGAMVPAMPYCKNSRGQGPAWSNSLFEDAAEFGFGMMLGANEQRDQAKELAQEALAANEISGEPAAALQAWLDAGDDPAASRAAADRLLPLLERADNPLLLKLNSYRDHLVKKSFWAFGGDGWAYDIGYGGLDHVLASGEDINLLVLDTEVYSNTGGQSSKATPTAAIAKFAASGKRSKKKDLGLMARGYGYVYVAQIAMGASQAQTLRAIKEAEAYPGPSLIIAYSTCINHGLKAGMNNAQTEMKNAVDCGYWHLYRYNPLLKAEGKTPFILDSKEPDYSKFRDFIMGEVRYNALYRQNPDLAEELFAKTEQDARERLENYLRLARG